MQEKKWVRWEGTKGLMENREVERTGQNKS